MVKDKILAVFNAQNQVTFNHEVEQGLLIVTVQKDSITTNPEIAQKKTTLTIRGELFEGQKAVPTMTDHWSKDTMTALTQLAQDLFDLRFYFLREKYYAETSMTYLEGLSSKSELSYISGNVTRTERLSKEIDMLVTFILANGISQSAVEIVLFRIQQGEKDKNGEASNYDEISL